MYAYGNPADTVSSYTIYNDTLTIGYNNTPDNSPFQDINIKRYNNFYKCVIIVTGIYADAAGTLVPATLTDPSLRNFKIEGSILTQHYDKTQYGSMWTSEPAVTQTADPYHNFLDLTWDFAAPVTPVNWELEWTYLDDYKVDPYASSVSTLDLSDLTYNFTNNSTRVWLDSNSFRIPLTYPSGYLVYRVRAVRPDSVLFRYNINGKWSHSLPDSGYLSATPSNAYYHLTGQYTNDSINWQYNIHYAEGGKYKHVVNFYDGLLKNRQSITRFNSSLNKLIATNNIYDYEGRLSIKTLPAPVSSNGFFFQHNMDLNSLTNAPYRAYDFDSGIAGSCPLTMVIPPLHQNALASIYYSPHNPDTGGINLSSRYIPDAKGYPLIQTIFEPGFADRVAAQGGAGPKLQIGDSNTIFNAYVDAMQKPLNALFGPNLGWSNFYTMTVSSDPNQQTSMTVKDYHGKTIASSLIGQVDSTTHALVEMNAPNPTYYKQDLLLPQTNQIIDTLANTRVMDADFYNEKDPSIDSIQYNCMFNPFKVCSDQWIETKAHYSYYITDQCGNAVLSKSGIIGADTLLHLNAPLTFYGVDTFFIGHKEAYHVHKDFSFAPTDITATLDTFFNHADCFKSENSFIRESVDSKNFPARDLQTATHVRN